MNMKLKGLLCHDNSDKCRLHDVDWFVFLTILDECLLAGA